MHAHACIHTDVIFCLFCKVHVQCMVICTASFLHAQGGIFVSYTNIVEYHIAWCYHIYHTPCSHWSPHSNYFLIVQPFSKRVKSSHSKSMSVKLTISQWQPCGIQMAAILLLSHHRYVISLATLKPQDLYTNTAIIMEYVSKHNHSLPLPDLESVILGES